MVQDAGELTERLLPVELAARGDRPRRTWEGLRRVASPLLGLALFAAALWVLRRELRHVGYHQLTADLLGLPAGRLVLALALTAANYAVLTGYDQLAFAYIGRRLSRWRVAMASFVAYAIANNVGFAMVSGASVRYRFYTRWGLTAGELSRIVLFYSTTFWLGLLVLGGWTLAAGSLPSLWDLPGHDWLRALGVVLLLVAAAYALAPALRSTPIRLGPLEVPLPTGRLVAAQFLVSVVDWALAAAVLYALLPRSTLSFGALLGAFVAAQLLGLASHVPGGLGVFESALVILVKPHLTADALLPGLVLYRCVYYLLPLGGALVALAVDELRQRRDQAARVGAIFGALAEEVTPRILAMFTFLGGVVLLFSGATPAAAGRLEWLNAVLPLAVIEASHFVGSVVGVLLLLVSQGVARRLDAAYYLAAGGVAIGVVASVLKGVDVEEATVLTVLLVALVHARSHFDRKAAFFATRFSPGWVAAVVAMLGASVWIGFFAFRHVEYSGDLWWQFELNREASRFLRASMGAAMALLLFGAARLLRPEPPEVLLPSDDEMADVDRVVASQASTAPFPVYLRDKAVLFNETRTAFVMYGVQGRTWVALGDPVGPPESAPALIREFLERSDDFGAEGVFYQASKARLHQYADFGLTFAKLGEEARVPVGSFSLEGSANKPFRVVARRLEKDGGRFRLLPSAEVPSSLEALREVSDEWLESKVAAEKGFSLGFFDPEYIVRFPVGVVEVADRIEAFANLWPGPQGTEVSVDLMRFRASAPKNVMEALLIHLMLWSRQQGYQWFNLGMAPLSGLEASAVAPLWTRLGLFFYEHGETFYNFQGLRAFKDKFGPVWEPRYLAYGGGLSLPRILADISALIAGGYRRIFLK